MGFLRRFAPIADQVMVSGGNFLTIAICARLLVPDEQGKLGIILSTYLFMSVINLTTVFHWAAVQAAKEEDKQKFLSHLADYQVYLALFNALLFAGFLTMLGDAVGWQPTSGERFVIAGFYLVQQLADFDRRAAYIFSSASRALASSAAMYPARVALLLALRPSSVEEVYFLASLTTIAPAFITLSRKYRSRTSLAASWTFLRSHLYATRWLLASAPLMWGWGQVTIYFLGNLAGIVAVGIFFTIRSITNVANFGMEIIDSYYSPRLSRVYHSGNGGEYRRLILTIMAVGFIFWLAGLGLVIGFGEEIIGLAVGEAYTQYDGLLTILWVSALTNFLFRLGSANLRTTARTKIIPYSYAVGVVAAALVSMTLIPAYGIYGAALAQLSATIGIVAGQVIFRRFRRFRD